jgi:hypothetical protein
MILDNLISTNQLIIILSFLVIFTAITSILMIFLRHSQRQNKDLIDTMRDSYEKQIYILNDSLTSSMNRWRDVNHLLLGSQAAQPAIDQTKRPHYTSFLKANGIFPNDIDPDPQLVFVLTPFNNRFDDVFNVIRRTCADVGLKCYRGDEQFLKGDILPHILRLLCKASIVIANIEGRNANVFYELGLAHAMDRNTLLVSKTIDALPIDVKSKKIIVYRNTNDLSLLLKDELLKLAYLPKIESNSDTNRKRTISDLLLSEPITLESLIEYTKWKYQNLPVDNNLTILMIKDINELSHRKYSTIRDIDNIIELAKDAVLSYQNDNPDWFKSGTDYITKSLGFVDQEFRTKHAFGTKTKDAFRKYEHLVTG